MPLFLMLPGLIAAAADDDDDEKKIKREAWDVENPPGPSYNISIDADEGTWLSLDVSPDGSQLVFDFLGDLFLLPIEGGEARALTKGLAWDMQPRFSPDGNRIAFISDRDGADNLWLISTEGDQPQQVSKEDLRLVHNPAWDPGGKYVAVRKHFTKTRSAGAGEIWLYHTGGGKGLRMVEKLNDQKDINEPAFSPDGRYLYFTLDVTPGEIFEYNKDSNGEIYQVRRLDRDTGRIEPYISGPGGAVRPTPSPDGKKIAFIRRVRYQTTLFVKDIASGIETALYDRMERDNQEIWAIHGVYPGIAWTPDSEDIVFWAGGKIRRIKVGTREASVIPFHVNKQQKMMEAVRFPVNPAPAEFDVRMLRWVTVSPAGDQVVFQALGHLYIRDLPDGRPRRLSVQNDQFEFYPSFSRDGRWIVYTTWNDLSLGSVRKISVHGGGSLVLTPDPGHYVEPAFSPDSQTVVYRKLPGNFFRSPWWGETPGIYEIPASGGDPGLVTHDGQQPVFGASNDFVYVRRSEKPDESKLVRIEIGADREREILNSKYVTDFAISPDEQWVAFRERYNAYVTPLPRSGQPVSVGPKMKSLSVAKVSRDAGNYLHWSGDSSRLYWSTGPDLFGRSLTDAFDFLSGPVDDDNEPAASEPDVLRIGFRRPSDVPEGLVAFRGAKIITMNGGEIIDGGTVLVDRNRIAAVGPQSAVEIPPEALVIDTTGKTIMPGIIDVHWHGPQASDGITPQQNWENYSSLTFGVTTIHDPSNRTASIFAAKELQLAGMITAPRIFSTGRVLYGATTATTVNINSLDDARSHLRRLKAVGAESVKSYNQPRRDQRQQILSAARELGINVFPEAGALFQTNMGMIADGHSGIEHSLVVANAYDDVVQLWSQSRVGYTPTLVVAYGGLWGENYWYQQSNVYDHRRLLAFVPRETVDPRARRRIMAPDNEFNHIAIARQVDKLNRAGVSVQLGAHGQREGLGAHWEIWMFVQGGMTPHRALTAATLNGARYLGMDKHLGSLEPGKLADLIVLDQDPLENIRNTEHISRVMVNGRLYDAWTMNEVGNHPRERVQFYFEY